MLSAFTTTVRSDVEIDLASMNPQDDENLRQKINSTKNHLISYEKTELRDSFKRWYKKQESSPKVSQPTSPCPVLKSKSNQI